MHYVIISVIFLFLIITYIIRASNKKSIVNSQLIGIDYIAQLKPLITLIQQHRGLNSAYLSGDDTVTPKLSKIQSEITKIIDQLNVTELASNERWLSFTDHWNRLLNLAVKPTADNSFEQHCSIVKNLSYLLEDTSETYHLTADYCSKFQNIGLTFRELVVLSENIGQARAIGTGVCVQKKCSSVNKIRLNFLAENIKKITTETLSNLCYLPEEINKHNLNVNKSNAKVDELTSVILKDIVNNNTVSIESQVYFAMASSTIASFDDIFYHQVEQLKSTLK